MTMMVVVIYPMKRHRSRNW